eukprot:TRINITY_DN16301_c0_g1_i2.p1 TRINITY_DN16301_c0_g1~~TRINITY_DN16301_c0_g1_i2.p1  ORF type:complete len:491 (+),score=95.99 TRINITY_DN16301_c0_g1_i2:22-1494(+)
MMDGGRLWQLSIEDDLLSRIFLDLDPVTLRNIELSSVLYWSFVKRTLLWKKKFDMEYPGFLSSTENSDILNRMKNDMAWDDHFKYKKFCLKLWHLNINWKKRKYLKKSINLQKVFNQETIQCMNTNLILTVTQNSFFATCGAIFDINKWDKIRHFQKAPKFHIHSADLSLDHLVLFGEPKYLQNSAPDFEYNFVIKIFSTENYDFLKQTVVLHENEVTQWSQVRVSNDLILLFESHFLAKELNTETNFDALHIFNHNNTECEYIEHIRKIVLDLPVKKYLSMCSFDAEFLIGCRIKDTFVEVWDLKAAFLFGDKYKAGVVWSSDVGYRNTIKCSAILFKEPFAFIGKSNGRCDIWNVTTNTRTRSLEHDVTDANIFLTIKKIIVLNQYILTLTQRGKIYVWDKALCLESPSKAVCLPVWTCSSSVSGNVICDLYADTSRLVCLESNMRDGTQWLEVKDLWHCYQNKVVGNGKRKAPVQNKFEKRKLSMLC